MDFIERIFGIAPDSGSGLTEALLILALAAVAAIVVLRPWAGARRGPR